MGGVGWGGGGVLIRETKSHVYGNLDIWVITTLLAGIFRCVH